MPRRHRKHRQQPIQALAPGTKTAEDVFTDFDKIHPGPKQGQAVWSDADKVEGMNLSARRMIIDGDVHYEITGKLRSSAWMMCCRGWTGQTRRSQRSVST